QVFVSPISAWEISFKEQRGELTLPLPAEAWFPAVVEAHCLTLHPLSVETLIAANRLPWHHRDPADRFILAAVRSLRVTVVTADKRFPAYGVDVVL
ncbi:type II toxin-antitoxin system VapC family toxin, partial [Arthrospira platensis SPKY1]|nr:type II toxin-antitoxin system VapC family toxin [Arthrospira platensis SPKY1]